MAPRPKKQMKKKKQQQNQSWRRLRFGYGAAHNDCAAASFLSFFFWGSICIQNEHVKSISKWKRQLPQFPIRQQTAQARPFSRSNRARGSISFAGSDRGSGSISFASSDRGRGSGVRVSVSGAGQKKDALRIMDKLMDLAQLLLFLCAARNGRTQGKAEGGWEGRRW